MKETPINTSTIRYRMIKKHSFFTKIPSFPMKMNRFFLFQWLLLLIFMTKTSICLKPHKIPRLTPLVENILQDSNTLSSSTTILPKEFETYYYNQTLDHFNYGPKSYLTFNQRYIINSKYWGGSNSSSPIFAYLGAESSISRDPLSIGFLTDFAPQFKALLVYMEHRYYGESRPLGKNMEEALKDEEIRGYFNSAQAIADYAEILLYIKEKYSAKNSPIIVIGGSYGGMLASWFRMKYPHIALGALASSAPILYFDNITPQNGYYSIVSKDFKEASKSCYHTIRKSWSIIDKIASRKNGLSYLSQKFKTCSKLNDSFELKDYLDSIYSVAAQYNRPPIYPVTRICGGIDGAPKESDILDKIQAGIVAFLGNLQCHNTKSFPTETGLGWTWQTCSEMVMPIGRGANDTMFFSSPFNLNKFKKDCKAMFGVSPRPHWITTYYGGYDIKLILHKSASNIIFSNGLRDPYSSGGVLKDISSNLQAVHTHNGSHCLDILAKKPTDPEWLTMQREKEVKIIKGWITNYYADIKAFKKGKLH